MTDTKTQHPTKRALGPWVVVIENQVVEVVPNAEAADYRLAHCAEVAPDCHAFAMPISMVVHAPDLLAACEDMAAWGGQLHSMAWKGGMPDQGAALGDSLNKLRAAIARAKGETP